jgi:tRNA(Ile)-lysidine synthase
LLNSLDNVKKDLHRDRIIQLVEQRVENFLNKHGLCNSSKTLLVAFSGRADSLCLLDVLKKLSIKYSFKLAAGHLNHNWRGEESKQEEMQAREYCLLNNIDFYCETLSADLPHSEEEARKQRYDFLNRLSKEISADAILTGHTYTDNVETILYRIIKGTGINGLKGIPEVRFQENNSTIYRPLLKITRDETVKYCQENNLKPSIDSSNSNQKYLRNKIRLSLIPKLKTYNKEVEKALIRLSEVANDSEEIIEEYIQWIKSDLFCDDAIITAKFKEFSCAVQKKLIIDLIEKENIEYDFGKISEIIDFINEAKELKSGNTLSLTTAKWLFCSNKIIKIIDKIKSDSVMSEVEINLDGSTFHNELKKTLVAVPCGGNNLTPPPIIFPAETSNKAFVDLSGFKNKIVLRARREGDVIQPLGMRGKLKGKMKLKKYLINKGIPEFERDTIPVLASGSEILWAVGVGLSELIRVKDTPSHILEII